MTSIARSGRLMVVLPILLLAAPASGGAVWTVDWWTLDGGGEVFTSGGDWELSGTFGQWDATPSRQSTGGSWALTGGFWVESVAAAPAGPGPLFADGFEEPSRG